MLKNFFRTAFRAILKNKTYSIINFSGLVCGLTVALLIFGYVSSELSFDKFHAKGDRIYRIKYTAPNGLLLATTPPPIAPVLGEYFPGVESAARLYGRSVSISRPDNADASFEESSVFFADSSIVDIFSFEFIRGNASTALKDEFTVVITEEMAQKYFGDADPIGETLLFAGKHSFKVTAVVKRFPDTSHISFNMLVPYENMFDLESDQAATLLRNNLAMNFVISHSYTYVLLKEGASPTEIDQGFPEFLKRYAQPQLLVGQIFTLFPLYDIHLKSDLLAEPSSTNSMTNIFIFIGVGVLTLLIAAINYINLTTAQSFTRIKEIGVRKVLGSMTSLLIIQFLAESFLFCVAALIVSFGLMNVCLPLLNELTQKSLVFADVVNVNLIIFSLVLVVVITLIAGGYPAYFVARFNSINALKGAGITQYGSQGFRNALVIFQLAVASVLLCGSLLIVKQLDFLTRRNLGFNREQVVNVSLFSANLNGIFRQNDSTFWVRLQSYRDVIEAQSGVRATTLSSNAPGLGAIFRGTIPEGFSQEDNMFIANMSVDYDFIKTYGMELVAGRTFDRSFPSDVAEGFIINETAVKEFRWSGPTEAIGKTINREGKKGKVVGVIRDFNFTSLTTPVSAMVLEVNPNQYSVLSIQFDAGDTKETVKKAEEEWNRMFPEKIFEYRFLDEQLNQQYQNFENFGQMIQSFAIIAILISCLGVYGLILFIVHRKVKEIGVRKVMGASVLNILQLIYREFAWLLIAGFLVAVPVSYYLLSQWMQNFTYHTSIDVMTYLISFLLILVIVAVTIGHQAYRASMANPVNSLRSE